MGKFKEFINERNDNIKNWKDIVNKFDTIDDVTIQPNGKSLRVRGKKDGKFADVYTDYNNKEAAKGVHDKVATFIGIKHIKEAE